MNFLVFQLHDKKFAFHLDTVKRVVPIMDILPVPGTPDFFEGIINIGGQILPVFNLRIKFNFFAKPISIDEKMIIVQGETNDYALHVDDVDGVYKNMEQHTIKTEKVIEGLEQYFSGIIKLDGHIVLVCEIDKMFMKSELSLVNKIIGQETF